MSHTNSIHSNESRRGDSRTRWVVAAGSLLVAVALSACGAPEQASEIGSGESLGTTQQAWSVDSGDLVCVRTKDVKNAGTSGVIQVGVFWASDRYETEAYATTCDIDGIGRGEEKCCTLKGHAWWDIYNSCYGNDQFNEWASKPNVYLRLDSDDNAYITEASIHRVQFGKIVESKSAGDFYCEGSMNSCQSYDFWTTYHGWFKLGKGSSSEKNVRLVLTGGGNANALGESPASCLKDFAWELTY